MDIGNLLMSRRSATNDVDGGVLREGTVEGRDRVGRALLQSRRRSAMEASSEGGPGRVGLQGAPL